MTGIRALPGSRLLLVSWALTAAFTLSAGLAVADPSRFMPQGVAVDLTLFAIGCVTFFWAYALAVQRSRSDAIGIGGLYFLAGQTAPTAVKWHLLGAWAVQVVVAIAAASSRPFTAVAFAVLAPMAGLGLCGLWAAKFGSFGPRAVPAKRVAVSQNGRHG